jgi:anti-sigma regulatory factor (Ser/Thr protein kinase)
MTASGARTSADAARSSAGHEVDVTAQFAAHIESPRAARHFVIGVLREWGFSQVARDEAALVTTELTTNAVLHADSGFSLLLVDRGGVVRIAVVASCCTTGAKTRAGRPRLS